MTSPTPKRRDPLSFRCPCGGSLRLRGSGESESYRCSQCKAWDDEGVHTEATDEQLAEIHRNLGVK